MEVLYETGRVVDLVLAVMALEAVALVVAFSWTGRGIRPADVLGHLSAGFFLLLALRSALVGQHWAWTGLFLTASLPAHLIDLVRRWRTLAVSSRS